MSDAAHVVQSESGAMVNGFHSFRIHAAGSGQMAMRLLGLFAQLDVVPLRFLAESRGDDGLLVAIDQPDLTEHRAHVLLEKVRQVVGVERAVVLAPRVQSDVAMRVEPC